MSSSATADGLAMRPPRGTLLPTGRLVAAIDIGGTSIKAALFLDSSEPLLEFRTPTPRHQGSEAIVREVVDVALQLIDVAQRQHGASPAALGVACLGLVDDRRGIAIYSAAAGWRDLPLGDLLRSRLHLPVTVHQDIRAAAYAETGLPGGRQQSDPTLFVAIGTGIGGAIITGGHLQPGAHSRAGEIGHLQIRPQRGRLCRCGGIVAWKPTVPQQQSPPRLRLPRAEASAPPTLSRPPPQAKAGPCASGTRQSRCWRKA